jgi:O-succinylbenzoate synthase
VAAAIGLPCVVSSALETSVGLAAQLALAASLPDLRHACGLATRDLLDGDVVPAQQEVRAGGGVLSLPAIGPVPDPGLLRAALPADPARVRWWLERLARVAALAA